MADISRTKTHERDLTEIRPKFETLATEMSQKFGIQARWEGDICHLSGSMLKNGKVILAQDSVTIELNLGMMAKMLKGQIEKEIDARLDRILSA